MKNWVTKKLGEVCEKITDGSHNPPKGVDSGDFMMLSSKNIFDDLIHYEDPRYLTQKDFDSENKRTDVKYNDVLLTIVGTIGRVAVVPINHPKITLQRSVAVLKIKEKVLDSRFLMFSLQNILKFLTDEARGVAQKGIYLNQLRDIEIPLPPLPEQQRIVAILDEAFAAIAKAKANAEQNLKNAKDLFESYLQGVFENKGEDWEEKTLGEILVKTETVDPTKKPNEEFIYLDVSSVNKETKEIENATVLLGKDAPSRARKLVRTNDVIFATVRPTHSRVALITEEYNEQVCSTGYFVLRAKEFLSNNLVYYFLLTYSFNKQMEKLQKGASYPAVTDSEVKGIYISFPKSLKEQQTIVQKLNALSAETKKLEAIYQQKINDLEELKKSVLQKAFSGELKTAKACA
jgi:type I restriction enzyme S subunit